MNLIDADTDVDLIIIVYRSLFVCLYNLDVLHTM